MKRRHALPILAFSVGTVMIFISVEPRQGRATLADASAVRQASEPAFQIGTLEGRLQGVRIEATPSGPRYSVIGDDGEVIASRLDLQTLAERYPLLVPSEFYADGRGKPMGPLMIVPDDGTP